MSVRYQYLIVRYRPEYSRGEFVNLGVLMWVSDPPEILFRFEQQWDRVSSFFPKVDKDVFFQSYSEVYEALDLSYLHPPEDRFLELQRTILDPQGCFPASITKAGVCENPQKRLKELYQELVA